MIIVAHKIHHMQVEYHMCYRILLASTGTLPNYTSLTVEDPFLLDSTYEQCLQIHPNSFADEESS